MTKARKSVQNSVKDTGSNASAATGMHGREEMIAVAAYYRAEQRDFAPGDELGDWLQAEAAYRADRTSQAMS